MGLLGLEVRASEIQGSGLFATERILKGSVIAPAVLAGKKTEAGRFVNHSGTPNAKMVVRDEENVDLIAIREIIVRHCVSGPDSLGLGPADGPKFALELSGLVTCT